MSTLTVMPLRRAGSVRRFHTERVVYHQTVAEHVYGMMMLGYEFNRNFKFLHHLLYHVMTHDVGEVVTGDMPYPGKARFPQLRTQLEAAEDAARRELRPTHAPDSHQPLTAEYLWLKGLDMADALLYAYEERRAGNLCCSTMVPLLYEKIAALDFGPEPWVGVHDPEGWQRMLDFLYERVARVAVLDQGLLPFNTQERDL